MMKKSKDWSNAFLLLSFFWMSFENIAHTDSNTESLKKTFHELVNGNKRYMTDTPFHKNENKIRRKELIKGQKPNTIVLTCSDSRVPPEIIFDQGLGEIFTIRVAGNSLDKNIIASMEYAVEDLGSHLIIIMGHEYCGAIKAALSTPKGKSTGSSDLDYLLFTLKPNLEGFDNRTTLQDPSLHNPVIANVNKVTHQLIERSFLIHKKVLEGTVKIIKAIYALGSGRVTFWDTEKF